MDKTADLQAVMRAVAQAIIRHELELTDLDRHIGDGDHGTNMRRGFEAVLAELEARDGDSLPQLLNWLGTTLIMNIGGASGALYGTIFLTLGKELGARPSRGDFVRAGRVALSALRARGRVEMGQKTMLDVLQPALEAFACGGDPVTTARLAADATIPMIARRGRASFLGPRSAGHMDPGARSSALIITAAADAIGELHG